MFASTTPDDILVPLRKTNNMSSRENMLEAERRRNNERAWRDLTGYVTSSGCPMWDKNPNVCIPKSFLGYGYTINCWALCCCFLCQKPLDSTYRPTKRVWVFYVIIGAGLLVSIMGIVFAGVLSQQCQGFHDGGVTFNYECTPQPTNATTERICCHFPCDSTGGTNRCETLQDLGGGALVGIGIGLIVLGFLFIVPGIFACCQNAKALKAEREGGRPVYYANAVVDVEEPKV